MNAMAPCPPDSPLMKAWEAHKATEEYANSHNWAVRYIPEDDPAEIELIRKSGANPWTHQMKIQAAEGSLWAMFSAGWRAANGADPFKPVIGLRRGFSSPGFEQGKASEFDQFVNSVITAVAELPDRSSPEDEPDMMLVTAEELKTILCTRLNEALSSR